MRGVPHLLRTSPECWVLFFPSAFKTQSKQIYSMFFLSSLLLILWCQQTRWQWPWMQCQVNKFSFQNTGGNCKLKPVFGIYRADAENTDPKINSNNLSIYYQRGGRDALTSVGEPPPEREITRTRRLLSLTAQKVKSADLFPGEAVPCAVTDGWLLEGLTAECYSCCVRRRLGHWSWGFDSITRICSR